MRAYCAGLSVSLCFIFVSFVAEAAPRTQTAPTIGIQTAVAQLESSDPAEIRAGIESLALIDGPQAASHLSDRIRKGLPPDLLGVALDSLLVLEEPSSGPVLLELLRHRRADVRAKAALALAVCKPQTAESALLEALSDDSSEVRDAAATGLGQINTPHPLDRLFVALDHGVLPVVVSIGRSANADEVHRLLGFLGKVPLEGITPGLTEVLRRNDVPERAKLDVVAQLQELATRDVKVYLQALLPALPQGTKESVRRAIEEAIARIAN